MTTYKQKDKNMCLLINKPRGKKIDKDIYERGMEEHPDGAGIAFIDQDTRLLTVKKGLLKFDEFYDFLKPREDLEMVVHFRNASTGMVINEDNCHPFIFDTAQYSTCEREGVKLPKFQFALAHNGRLDWPHTKDKSDTHCFVDEFLAKHLARDPAFLSTTYGTFVVEKLIGKNNKMVVYEFNIQKNVYTIHILNEGGGHWLKGSWFSNYSYLKKPDHEYVSQMGCLNFDESYADDRILEMGKHAKYKTCIYYEADKWIKPDAWGWRWDYKLDCWRNTKSGVIADHLTSRPDRPAYMLTSFLVKNRGNKTLSGYTDGTTQGALPLAESSPPAIVPPTTSSSIIPVTTDKDKLTSPDGKVIEVPREEFTEANGKAKGNKSKEKNELLNLSHLSNSERDIIRKSANKYATCEAIGFVKNDLTNDQAIELMRLDIKKFIMPSSTDEEVDIWVIRQHLNKEDLIDALTTAMCARMEAAGGVRGGTTSEDVERDDLVDSARPDIVL